MEQYYVETGRIYVSIVNNKIFQIEKSKSANVDPHVIRVDCLDASTSGTYVHIADRNVYGDKSRLLLDAADIITFAAWLGSQMPRASTKAFGDAFFDHFPGSMNIADMVAAAGFVVCGPTLKRPAQGEELYFIAKARASDPDGFAILAAAYASRY